MRVQQYSAQCICSFTFCQLLDLLFKELFPHNFPIKHRNQDSSLKVIISIKKNSQFRHTARKMPLKASAKMFPLQCYLHHKDQ